MYFTTPSIPSVLVSVNPTILITLLVLYIVFSIYVIFSMQFASLMSLQTSINWKSELKWYLLFFPGTILLLFLMLVKVLLSKLAVTRTSK